MVGRKRSVVAKKFAENYSDREKDFEAAPRPKNGQLDARQSRDEALLRLQRMMKKYIKPGSSVVDEFLAERRAEAEKE